MAGGDPEPSRIRLSRAKGYRMPSGAMKVDRSTRWGNPFNATQTYEAFPMWGLPIPLVKLRAAPSLERCLDMYAAWLLARLSANPEFLEPLRGKTLACWCPLDKPCHAEILLRLANR